MAREYNEVSTFVQHVSPPLALSAGVRALSGPMTKAAFAAVKEARDEFRSLVEGWTRTHPYLPALLEAMRLELGYGDYRVETPIVFNRALDDITREAEIRVILVADNPGKNEQKAENRSYLVGHSGKLAERWFAEKLAVDFRREVLILNKTPVHSPKTAELKRLLALSGRDLPALESLLSESQVAMAGLAARLHLGLGGILWISGLGELRKAGLFRAYRDELALRLASMAAKEREGVLAFNHFSMNQFAIEFRRKADPGLGAWENLSAIGRANRQRVFGQ